MPKYFRFFGYFLDLFREIVKFHFFLFCIMYKFHNSYFVMFFFFCLAETQDTLPTVGSRPRPACEFACTALVAARGPRELLPGHGPPVTTPTWTADLNSRCRRGFQFQQPPNLQAGGGPPRVTPTGPLGGGAAGQHPPALRGICTPPLF